MIDIAGLTLGLLLGLWSTNRLEHDMSALVSGRRVSLPSLWRSWAIRFVPIIAVVCALLAWSSVAPLATLGGFWFGRTGYVVLLTRRHVGEQPR
ncbi:MAG TPA: hypothetical protein VGJ60_27850 [Chloroflexota bacterium]